MISVTLPHIYIITVNLYVLQIGQVFFKKKYLAAISVYVLHSYNFLVIHKCFVQTSLDFEGYLCECIQNSTKRLTS